ncbi:MAG: AP2 domain-containing protein [Micrococcales bacterium]|nr:AP2 domain-containing protein [Micrococcales bacterium]
MSGRECWCGKTHAGITGITHRQESGRWRARYCDPLGTWRTIGTFDTLSAAKQARDAEQGRVAVGTWRAPKAVLAR